MWSRCENYIFFCSGLNFPQSDRHKHNRQWIRCIFFFPAVFPLYKWEKLSYDETFSCFRFSYKYCDIYDKGPCLPERHRASCGSRRRTLLETNTEQCVWGGCFLYRYTKNEGFRRRRRLLFEEWSRSDELLWQEARH